MASSSTIQFTEFDVKDFDDINQRWTRWLSKLERYFTHQAENDDTTKINALFLFGGYDLETIYNQYKETADKYVDVKKKIVAHFNPKTSVQLNRFNFRNLTQFKEELFDEFVSRVRLAGDTCAFTNPEDEAASQIIQRCKSDKLKSRALNKDAITLTELIAMGRTDESITSQLKQLSAKTNNSPTEESFHVGNINQKQQNPYRNRNNNRPNTSFDSQNGQSKHQYGQSSNQNGQSSHQKRSESQIQNSKCRYCGQGYPHMGTCPAKGVTCNNCGKLHHFASVCRQGSNAQQQRNHVNFISSAYNEEESGEET